MPMIDKFLISAPGPYAFNGISKSKDDIIFKTYEMEALGVHFK